MSELTLIIIRIGFLALLWLFIFIVLYSLRSDLFGPRLTQLQQVAVQNQRSRSATNATGATAPAPAASASDAPTTITERAAPAAGEGLARRIVITSGPKSGLELDLPETGLTIGRSSGAGLQIKDDYTSGSHAKIVRWRDQWMLQDQGSTNGTFVDGKRVTEATPIRIGSSIRIGTTTFELRR